MFNMLYYKHGKQKKSENFHDGIWICDLPGGLSTELQWDLQLARLFISFIIMWQVFFVWLESTMLRGYCMEQSHSKLFIISEVRSSVLEKTGSNL